MDTTKFSGHTDFEWAVQLNRFSLKFIGLWPQKVASSRDKLILNCRLLGTISAIICFCTVPSVHSLIRVWGDMTAMIDNLLYTLPLLTVPSKMLIMWWKKKSLSLLITMISHDWIKSKSNNERDIMIRCAHNARLIIACSYIIIFSTLALVIIISAFGYTLRHVTNTTNTGRPLPMQAHYIYDTSVSPYFELTFFIQCVTLSMVSLAYTGMDNFLGLLIFHICGQLENLTNRLYRMNDSEDFTAILRINVKDHIRLIRSVALIEGTFTLMLLLIFLYFCTLFCVYGFLIVTVIFEESNVSIKRAIFLIMAICTVFTHMCIYCAVGELLVAKYEKVYNAIYECKWYMLESKKAKNLILLMALTNKPLYITAGKLLPMTMSTFCNILKTSGGYISILLANQN